MIRALRVGTVGARYRGARPGRLFALLPEPVNEDFQRLVSDVVDTLAGRYGEPSVVAPPRRQSWWARLARFGNRPQDITNPDKLAPDAALTSAATDDSYLEFAAIEFGRSAAQTALAMTFTSDGHPIIWVWLDDSVADRWSEILDAVTGDWPRSELHIALETLAPEKPRLSIELPRARLHRGDSASWTDGSRSLGLQAGLGVDPHEVYLPSESAWESAAPAWAATLRDVIVHDFEQLGVRVVELPNATIHGGDHR